MVSRIQIKFFSKFGNFFQNISGHRIFYLTFLTCCIWPAAPTAPPQRVQAMTLNSTAIEITWLPPLDNTLRGAIRFYIVNGTEAVTMDSTYYQEVNTTRAVFSGLHPHYMYSFSVAAIAIDPGPFSDTVSSYTEEDGKTKYTDNK